MPHLYTGDATNMPALNHRPGNAVLEDGGRIRIPLELMDSVERAINEGRASPAIRDAYAQTPRGMAKLADGDPREAAWLDAGVALADAWKNPAPVTAHVPAPVVTTDASAERERAHQEWSLRDQNAWRTAV